MAKQPQRLRMDKSRTHATVHGERAPGDPHQKVHFYQDGLPFDAEGLLIPGLVPEDKKAFVERRLKKQGGGNPEASSAAAEPVGGGAGDNQDDDREDGESTNSNPEVNLEAWLRGEVRYQWFQVAAAIRKRFAKNVSNQADAILYLVTEENVVRADQLAPAFQSALK